MTASRRSLLAGIGGVLGGGAVVGVVVSRSPGVDATSIDGFAIADGSATLDGEPDSVDVLVDGTFEWAMDSPVDTVRADLEIEHDGVVEQLDQDVVFDPALEGSREFSMVADLLEHPAVEASDFDVDEGHTETLSFDAAIEVTAVDGGSTEQLERVTDDFVIEVTGEGIFLSVAAEGEVQIR